MVTVIVNIDFKVAFENTTSFDNMSLHNCVDCVYTWQAPLYNILIFCSVILYLYMVFSYMDMCACCTVEF